MARLNIYDRRERTLVTVADALLAPAALRRLVRRAPARPTRILCLRLERIGDLLMILPALAELRALAPAAAIDLVVGSWNADVAAMIPSVSRVESIDAEWLARGSEARGLSPAALAGHALRTWRPRRYDLAINFEPDIRSNMALALAGAARTIGFASGGGGALLDVALDYDVTAHTTANALHLVRVALGTSSERPAEVALNVPAAAREAAAARLAPLGDGLKIGIHVSGGRAIKQWPEERFREVAQRLVADRNAAIVLTGAPGDRAQIDVVKSALPGARVVDLSSGTGLPVVAAAIQQLDLFVTGDTGPMHLAGAVGTPTIAIFGPSDPRRYGPRGLRDAVVRIDLPCSPCNRIRLPPERCTGHTPDCLAGIGVAQVLAAVDAALGDPRR